MGFEGVYITQKCFPDELCRSVAVKVFPKNNFRITLKSYERQCMIDCNLIRYNKIDKLKVLIITTIPIQLTSMADRILHVG